MRSGVMSVCSAAAASRCAAWLCAALLLAAPALGCYSCLLDVSVTLRLCWGHVLTQHNVRNVGSCFRSVERLFDRSQRVLEAGRVGEGYDTQLKKLLEEQILPMAEEFDGRLNYDSVYEERLQRAADRFIAAASKLPRVSGCVPPCGFQAAGAVYNCVTCRYDSCDFPLDCPVKRLNVTEFSAVRMWCEVPFSLPDDTEATWRYAEQVETREVEQFEEVTAGADRLYSIPAARRWHGGTYQCELYAAQRSVARLYFHLTVTPQSVVGHSELQETFDLSVLPGGRMSPPPSGSPHFLLLLRRILPPPALIATCITAVLLLLFLAMGVLYWCLVPLDAQEDDEA